MGFKTDEIATHLAIMLVSASDSKTRAYDYSSIRVALKRRD